MSIVYYYVKFSHAEFIQLSRSINLNFVLNYNFLREVFVSLVS